MSFETTEKWKRHKTELLIVEGSAYVRCARCHMELPKTMLGGEVVCTRYDRLFLGDVPLTYIQLADGTSLPSVEDCHAV